MPKETFWLPNFTSLGWFHPEGTICSNMYHGILWEQFVLICSKAFYGPAVALKVPLTCKLQSQGWIQEVSHEKPTLNYFCRSIFPEMQWLSSRADTLKMLSFFPNGIIITYLLFTNSFLEWLFGSFLTH